MVQTRVRIPTHDCTAPRDSTLGLQLPGFNPALAYEIPPQVTRGYAVNPSTGRKVLHLQGYKVITDTSY
ncbi:MAG: hypothetical protein DSM107014_15530 [Gomphosphaeria aponina SAG 52.96 = DSM 107014]|uniref:Uncharacterized protein n=1 Tax=Gomphosphaeria aponina SAG 52.96 = DSM 107014 TaxID=1521640 RepID=A0A941GZ16_9CHRO|nr:hypothetical protein [Gomphosphaeria aponina SAG 52.96 = DSM 107014]